MRTIIVVQIVSLCISNSVFYVTERGGVRKQYLPVQCYVKCAPPCMGPSWLRGRAPVGRSAALLLQSYLLQSHRHILPAAFCSRSLLQHLSLTHAHAHTFIKHTVSAQLLPSTPWLKPLVTPKQENKNKSFSFLLSAKLCRKATEPRIRMRRLARQPQSLPK